METDTRFVGIDLEEVFSFLYGIFTSGSSQGVGGDLTVFFYNLWERISFVGALITPVLLVMVAYAVIRLRQIRLAEMEEYKARAKPLHTEKAKNERWERVLNLVSSDRPGDWRLAILEADVMLDEALSSAGYAGEDLGGRLKAIEREDLQSLNDAWEAHKVRNKVAHAGSDFILTKRESRHAIDLFQKVFQELETI